ncbi:lysozyme inhibitor LprI family protein [Kangiella sediminilitoris]|uniref:Lysozyme inhibitor LprI-like N-terminal domain-containing protein n=1 Tax=Kangiella sediminilitoris TaxID=1144748 RepID=A0A1B3B7L0_9GAMM|nr:lysozyme inhibitor LprI family protein [Kangiella sediminilitoris]AOE48780.1 hypothetical protein KS2013_48 [Kangiella sediminilitoris]
MKIKEIIFITLCGLTLAANAQEINCDEVYTTRDMNHCASAELDSAERIMGQYLEAGKKRYSNDEIVLKSITEAQGAWLAYRKAHCGSVHDVWREGTIRSVMSISCSTELTKKRTHEIWDTYLTYMDSTSPILPEPSLD